MKRLTLEEIGKIAGVSRSTVSRVVNEQENVKPAVRARVKAVIEEMGYQPNSAARILAGHAAQIIALIIPQTAQSVFTDPYFPRLVQGVAQACNQYDYSVSLLLFHAREDEAKLYPRILRNQMFDGVVMTATHLNNPLIEKMTERNIPFVLVGGAEEEHINYVDVNNFEGAYMAMEHLYNVGHRRIALIAGPDDNLASIKRYEGYRQFLQDKGLPFDSSLVFHGDFSETSAFEGAQKLLMHNPDAIFAVSDTMAVGALRSLQLVGLHVPQDIALMGYDDLAPSLLTEPQLSTVHQPVLETGAMAVETLLDILKNGDKPTRRVVLPTKIVVRDSCGAKQRYHIEGDAYL
ncbi:MAG TPA: LacI family DNA-binding transcriptional regulator [Anaerolineae bacterium]|nr:LacI family DNA-binding transcriptional regulator [Anaerolineae bacterium]